ncbi:hypothetical protein CHU32_25365 [Superficieibacter electus]|uniref:Uncharacterized protein n=1 Tax=Superficieibacter electus TaxID=2022662 RepID=A0A2P5GHS0_9ENTR|nr:MULTISPECIES: pheA operon leader peptide PheL [Enterobacteriaceae]MDU2941584.1 pheA operon leader peptide PheL [Enterobacteriaceae bacterium]MCS2146897.1 pheA operon leader peptide PheL [Scandinavium manionii]MCS2164969.1 pheA operon leader peptide PheL [Scandinavium manionii]POP41800.1 hypothetical protein CHU33_21590 [Superficieibacter electus]POP42135.1 hypothetical protein CHU32_25365 [Superficieibacter electus]
MKIIPFFFAFFFTFP